MTIPNGSAVSGLLDRWGTRLIAICASVTAINFIGLAAAMVLISSQSSEGAKARTRQQAVYPVSVKLYVDAERRGVISRADLACFRDSARCPAPTP